MAAPERMPINKGAVPAAGAQPPHTTLRNVHLITSGDTFKTLYWDRETAGMRPNLVFVDQTGAVVFESNEVGLKGAPLDPQRKLAVVWGDSVVFSSGRGWPCLLDRLAPGYQFLNGGLDGDLYPNILRRADALNRSHSVALNLLMLGWHPFVLPTKEAPPPSRFGLRGGAPSREGCVSQGNRNLRSDLTAFLAGRTNVAVATMPTALNPRIIDRDLSPYIKGEDDDTGFRFLGNVQYRLEYARLGYEHIVERNAITREVCAELGVRLLDLFAIFNTKTSTISASISSTCCTCGRARIRCSPRSCTNTSGSCLSEGRCAALSRAARLATLAAKGGPPWTSPMRPKTPPSVPSSAPGSKPICRRI